MNKFDAIGFTSVIIPPRLTNLLQPADVCWFSKIKNLFCAKWNEWSINVEKNLTVYGNTKSPGYAQAIKWLSDIWYSFEAHELRRCFDNDCVSDTGTEKDEIGRSSLSLMANISEQTCFLPYNQNNNQLLDQHYCTPQTYRNSRVSSQPFNILTAGLSQDTSFASQHINNRSVYLSVRNINFDSYPREGLAINNQSSHVKLILNHQNEVNPRNGYNINQIQHTQQTSVQVDLFFGLKLLINQVA
ncbi:unnamed protein product [Brachionus calyciflorus]|uniref:DDE-1 domain-containing protein n=1 Tax=Brachionus calyciflorus TaxID=104777 RepID=A0A813PPZ1_9BILA|nr:unnamed protein product [Brachionus calyciflorus]